MSRRAWSFLFVCALLIPSSATAQGTTPPAPSATEAEEAEAAEVFLGAFRAIRNYHMDSMPDSVLWKKALDGLIEELDDPYATVFTPEEFEGFQENNTGNYAGIGVTITQLNDQITVTAVFRGAPADEAGLQVGDNIVGVNGEDATSWTVQQASEQIRGPVGSSVDVRVSRQGVDGSLPFTIDRDNVHVSAVTAEMLEGDIGYILLDRVARNAAAEVDSAITHLDGARGLVFDLRRNPGGYLDEALDLADLFLEPGKVIANARSRVPGEAGDTREESWEARSNPRLEGVPVVVLVDEYSASASEIVAGALQDHDRALVMGERTFGKGVVQTVMRIPGDHRLRLTTGSWYTPLGRSLHRPRDAEGRPLPAAEAEPRSLVTTEAGRELVDGGGGVFPDLPVQGDTLQSEEQALIQAAAEIELPLNVRVAEFAFQQAQGARNAGAEEIALDPAALDAFVDRLVDEGVAADVIRDPTARAYLDWRIRGQIANRMDRTDLSLAIRMERDNVLSQAVRLLEGVDSQSALFAAAREVRDRAESQQAAAEAETPAHPEPATLNR